MGHIFLSFLFFNIILFSVYNHFNKGDYYIGRRAFIIYILLFIAFGTFGGGAGDYIHYKDSVENFHSLYDILTYRSMEKQYVALSYFVNGNYNLWRLILYSIQFVGLGFFLYKAKLNTYPVLLCFVAYLLVTSVYGRAFWGAIYFFMGLYLLIEKKNPLYLLAIISCYFSHTQNIVLLALLPLAFIKLKKWHIVFVFVFIGVLASTLSDFIVSYLDSGGIEGAEYVTRKVETYSASGDANYFGKSIGEKIIFVLRYLPIATIFVTWLNIILRRREVYRLTNKSYRSIINVTVSIVILSIVIILAKLGSGSLFYRILALSLFPISVILPYMYNQNLINRKTFNVYIFVFILLSEFGYILNLYYAYASGIA